MRVAKAPPEATSVTLSFTRSQALGFEHAVRMDGVDAGDGESRLYETGVEPRSPAACFEAHTGVAKAVSAKEGDYVRGRGRRRTLTQDRSRTVHDARAGELL